MACRDCGCLRPGGQLILAIPDKRYCFDYLRQPTRLSELVDAWLRRNRRPSPAQIFDYNVNAVELDMAAAWAGPLDPSVLQHYVQPHVALERSIQSVRDELYIDSHCWVFTPRSLLTLLSELVDLDLLSYSCARFFEPERDTNEMVLVLRRYAEVSGTPTEKARAKESFLTHLRQLDFNDLSQVEAVDSMRTLQNQNRQFETTVAELRPVAESVPALEARLRALEADINALRASTSWRITRPLRRLRRWIDPARDRQDLRA